MKAIHDQCGGELEIILNSNGDCSCSREEWVEIECKKCEKRWVITGIDGKWETDHWSLMIKKLREIMKWICLRHGEQCRDKELSHIIKSWNKKKYKNTLEVPENERRYLKYLRLK